MYAMSMPAVTDRDPWASPCPYRMGVAYIKSGKGSNTVDMLTGA